MSRFFQSVETRAWTDAEKELESLRKQTEDTPWYKGYVKALEGLLLTFRTNDDKYIYLPKALVNRTEESVNRLRKDFGEFASDEIHGEYDRGYFKALEDYTTALVAQKTVAPENPETSKIETTRQAEKEASAEKAEPAKKDADLSPYLEGSS